jgi:hypothetical protein
MEEGEGKKKEREKQLGMGCPKAGPTLLAVPWVTAQLLGAINT